MTRFPHKLLFTSLFLFFYILRLLNLDSPLPPSWTAESMIGFTARILDIPEQTDSKTVIRRGNWTVKLKGIKQLEMGKTYKFVGTVQTKVLVGKIYRIEMVDPTFELVNPGEELPLSWGEKGIMAINVTRDKLVKRLQKLLPEPHASLAAGILLGVKQEMPYEFYQALINSGTLHIAAASGYNVNVVAATINSMLAPLMGKYVAVGVSLVAILTYVLLAGGSAAVVRAGVMGMLALVAVYLGRPAVGKRLYWLTGAMMLMANPLIVADVGFLLSMSAMGGLLYIQPWIEKLMGNKYLLVAYFYPTLAAMIATAPVTLVFFGCISGWGLISNLFILPLIPLIMGLSAITLILPMTSYLLYGPLHLVVMLIKLFGGL